MTPQSQKPSSSFYAISLWVLLALLGVLIIVQRVCYSHPAAAWSPSLTEKTFWGIIAVISVAAFLLLVCLLHYLWRLARRRDWLGGLLNVALILLLLLACAATLILVAGNNPSFAPSLAMGPLQAFRACMPYISIGGGGEPHFDPRVPLAVVGLLFLLHASLLLFARKSTTHSIRRTLALIPVSLGVGFALFSVFLGWRDSNAHELLFSGLVMSVAAPIVALFLGSGFIVFSMPSTKLTLLPLFINYAALCAFMLNGSGALLFVIFAYLPLAGLLFPKHRRMAEYWRPTRLPNVPVRKDGDKPGPREKSAIPA